MAVKASRIQRIPTSSRSRLEPGRVALSPSRSPRGKESYSPSHVGRPDGFLEDASIREWRPAVNKQIQVVRSTISDAFKTGVLAGTIIERVTVLDHERDAYEFRVAARCEDGIALALIGVANAVDKRFGVLIRVGVVNQEKRTKEKRRYLRTGQARKGKGK